MCPDSGGRCRRILLATAKSKIKTPPKKAKPTPKKPVPKTASKSKVAKKPAPKSAKVTAKVAKKPVAKPVPKTAKKPAPKVVSSPKAKATPPKAAKPPAKGKPASKTAAAPAKLPAKGPAKPALKVPAKPVIKAPGKAPASAIDAKGAGKSAAKDVAVGKPSEPPIGRGVAAVVPASPMHSMPRVTLAKPVPKPAYVEKTPIVKFTPSTVREGGMLSEAEIMRQPKGEYMSKQQLAFFKHRLLNLQNQLRENAGATTEHLREISVAPDPADRATLEEEHALELRTRDRERKLLKKVESALERIEDGSYGYCEETGEPIGIPRLLARPTATLTIEAQERRELKQRMYGE
ncbi:MAG: RNA polymerase-binding protein DksA [Betaproteobacteria bacterium]|nr:RNA polymerase-binding protein DksA [Betaproteobacteria bacterium]